MTSERCEISSELFWWILHSESFRWKHSTNVQRSKSDAHARQILCMRMLFLGLKTIFAICILANKFIIHREKREISARFWIPFTFQSTRDMFSIAVCVFAFKWENLIGSRIADNFYRLACVMSLTSDPSVRLQLCVSLFLSLSDSRSWASQYFEGFARIKLAAALL